MCSSKDEPGLSAGLLTGDNLGETVFSCFTIIGVLVVKTTGVLRMVTNRAFCGGGGDELKGCSRCPKFGFRTMTEAREPWSDMTV